MRAAIYARVSTLRQARAQNIDEQAERLKAYAEQKSFGLEEHVYVDESYSGASLNRPRLNALRDAAAMAEFEVVLAAASDRLARKTSTGCCSSRHCRRPRLSGGVPGEAP